MCNIFFLENLINLRRTKYDFWQQGVGGMTISDLGWWGVYRRALATPGPVINHNINYKGAPGFARVWQLWYERPICQGNAKQEQKQQEVWEDQEKQESGQGRCCQQFLEVPEKPSRGCSTNTVVHELINLVLTRDVKINRRRSRDGQTIKVRTGQCQ